MKNIAIIGNYNYHLECIAFILETFINDNVNIYIGKSSDRYNFLQYYKSLYNFKVIYDCFSNKIIDQYDKIFKLTSDDYCLDHNKIISILHLNGPEQLRCKSDKFLSITPYIKGSNIYYTFPVFSPVIQNSENNKIVTMVGYYLNSNFDKDTVNFITRNNHYIFNFIVWGDSNYNNIRNLPNVNIYHNIDTIKMMTIINNSKYILSKKYINYDRFSGQLNLAVSFEKPLLIDSKTQNSYNLPGITFNKNYSELGNLDIIDNYKYRLIKKEIQLFKKEMLQNNNITLNEVV